MASGEAEAIPDSLQTKTVVLKVFIHCPGCKKKVQRIVKRINGVSTCEVDALHNKVTVTGNVDADYLIKKLLKSGKQADLWPEPKKQKPPPSTTTDPQNPNPNTTQKKEPDAPKETSEKSQKKPSETPDKIPSETPPKEIAAATDTKAAKEPQKSSDEPKKSAKGEDPKPNKSKTDIIPTSSEEAGSSTAASKKEKKGQKNSKPADKREADSAAPAPPLDALAHQMYLTPQPPAPAVLSYNTVQPSTSHAYYADAPMQHMPQVYGAGPMPHMMSQGYAPAPMPHAPQGYAYAPYYPPQPMPPQLPLEDLYYGPPGSRTSSPPRDQYEYSVFNDENANSCNVM